MKRFFCASLVIIAILITSLALAITASAEAVPVTVIADEGWGNATYDPETGELHNIDGGYSFILSLSGTNATLKSSSEGIPLDVTKVVLPYQIIHGDETYTVKAQEQYLLKAKDESGELKNDNFSVTEIIISEGIETLSPSVFRSAKGVVTIKLPQSLKTIDSLAFHSCQSLVNIEIPEGVTKIGAKIFSGCSSLVSMTLPSTITDIDTEETFMNCKSLVSVEIKIPLTTIKRYMFRGCSSLVDLEIPSTVTGEIGAMAFTSMPKTEFVFPEGVTGLGSKVFEGAKVQRVIFKGYIENIGNEAFKDAKSLNTIIFEGNMAPSVFGTNPFANVPGANLTVIYPADGIGYTEPGFQSAFPEGTTFQPASSGGQQTSCQLINITSSDTGYTVEYEIVLGDDVSDSSNIIALYNGDTLVAVKLVSSDETTVTFEINEQITKASIFVWDSLSNVKPLCESYSITI